MTTRPDPRAAIRTIRDLLTPPVHILPEDASLQDLARAFASDTRSHTAYLTTPYGQLVGVVPFSNLRRALHQRIGARLPGLVGIIQRAWQLPMTNAIECASNPRGASLETRIQDALFTMAIHKLTDLPILDELGRLKLEFTHLAHAKLLNNLASSHEPNIIRRERGGVPVTTDDTSDNATRRMSASAPSTIA